jgi:hypothetical protein
MSGFLSHIHQSYPQLLLLLSSFLFLASTVNTIINLLSPFLFLTPIITIVILTHLLPSPLIPNVNSNKLLLWQVTAGKEKMPKE